MGDFWSEDIVKTASSYHPKTNGVEHPALFPEQIVVVPILQTSNEGDLIPDQFHGSGTTGNVSRNLNRRYVGYDLKTY